MKTGTRYLTVALLAATAILPSRAFAHCDTLDGPVVAAARIALQERDVTPVLKWIKPEHETELRGVFDQALNVRGQSAAAAELADRYFFETLVRIHRAGEGAPYTGLKEAGAQGGIEAADQALASGNADALVHGTIEPIEKGIRERFERVKKLSGHAEHTVQAGREYVAAYVDYVHFVERLATAAASATDAHTEHAH